MEQGGLLYDVTYQRIRSDIMDLTLEPGTALSVRKFADRYQVSRTPAREAVIRLQKENLVNIYPQSKTIVSKISIKRIQEEQFIRKTLELAATDDFIANGSSLVTDAMEYIIGQQKKYLHMEKSREFFESDNNFHRLIFDTAEKSLAWTTVNVVSSHYNRFRFLSTEVKGLDQRIVDEHIQILQAAKAGDAAEMKRLLAVHVDYIQTEFEKLLAIYPQYFAAVR